MLAHRACADVLEPRPKGPPGSLNRRAASRGALRPAPTAGDAGSRGRGMEGAGVAGARGPASSACYVGPAHAAAPQPPGGGHPRVREASRDRQAAVGIVSAASVPEATLRP